MVLPAFCLVSLGDVIDRRLMASAIALAARGLGETWPNPSVGCILATPQNQVIARARTAMGGRPHAETQALAQVGAAARGATAYVTLEPCAHDGSTPPCADALIAAGITRAVIACRDPDPRTNGQGIARLRAAGIDVSEGTSAVQAGCTLAGFFSRVRLGRPWVTLKLATTIDGRIATRTGESRWISGPLSRRLVHAMRGRHDAVMTGIGTVLADDPDLTCRLPGYIVRPRPRLIVDTNVRTPRGSRLVKSATATPTWIIHAFGSLPDTPGVRAVPVPEGRGGVDLSATLRALGQMGLTSVLVEGGGTLAAGLLRADLIDRLMWFCAPTLLGADGWPSVAPLGIESLAASRRFQLLGARRVGDDVLIEAVRADLEGNCYFA